ncbi:LacI family transcriptional regulator [Iodidimonas muriae]|uniref:LacI family transcriptional regulator n=1 Tax=Iodidimonas muriae TaxID=261467 RepID=A0ABQ2LF64_9PROT|nr:LacI family DNA-binding transcriptional regulator [Iodidimonas muriae]GER07952.1 LacI family transcriptional regulator [Kordiimonadales bacterium JCM 17843]GGO11790.1 LacI family transcriptional regulator [Iodidimonas muriae]
MTEGRQATIKDVAKGAGVSIKTVSRVLNDEPNVRPATRERVLAAAKGLDYFPNPAARRLAGRRSYLIALAYDNPSPSYLADVIEGIMEVCRSDGYFLALHGCDFTAPSLAREMVNAVRESRVDGLVLTPPVGDVAGLCETLSDAGIHYVRLAPSGPTKGLGVSINDRQAAFDMTEYLLELGHRRIGFVQGHPRHGTSRLREEGYRAALERYGLEVEPALLSQGWYTLESGIEAARALLRADARPTAIFASNDDMAAGVIQEALRRGLRVPEDLSVAGFDDVPIARMLSPRLTTIRQPVQAMGKRATELLFENLSSGEHVSTQADRVELLDYRMLVRPSTAAPR